MIQASGTINGKRMMLLGLSGENITRLIADEPIKFDGTHLGFRGTIMIVYGKTDKELKEQLHKVGWLK